MSEIYKEPIFSSLDAVLDEKIQVTRGVEHIFPVSKGVRVLSPQEVRYEQQRSRIVNDAIRRNMLVVITPREPDVA